MADSDHQEKLKDCVIKRTRNGNEHIKNCRDGYYPTTFRIGWQSHHILPVSALADGHIKAGSDNKAYILDCLCITDWNVNASPNLIGLDTKWPYKLNLFASFPGLNAAWATGFAAVPLPENLPSHLIDHDLYTAETYEYMNANVWDTLKDAREIHKLNPKSIKGELDDASTHFKGELKARGVRSGGTLHCWKNRFAPGMEETWYLPFSMSDSPRKRHPGAPSVQNWLSQLFATIK